MNERETALQMAASLNLGKNCEADHIIREAKKLERYLNGNDGAQPPETDPDFAEVEGFQGEKIDCSAVADAIDGARRSFAGAKCVDPGQPPPWWVLTPNDVTRGRCIMREMLSKNGWTAPHVTLCDDIVRTILRGFLDARSE